MNIHTTPSRIPRIAVTGSAIVIALIMQACRSKDDGAAGSETQTEKVQAFTKSSLSQNQGQNKNQAQSSLLSSQASSPVRWQNWHEHLLKHAASDRKTIFAIVGSGTDPNTLEVLNRINGAPSLCSLLNDHHVNVLIDSNLHPDLDFLAASICLRSKTKVSSPILIWFSYEGHPISWSPVGPSVTNDIAELITRMSHTIHTMWIEDPEYVLKHSRDDYTNQLNLDDPKPLTKEEYSPTITLNAIRSSASLFDPTSNTIDGIGNLNIARYIELMVKASQHADLSKPQRDRYLRIASLITDHLIIHGLTDPLDGGVFSGVRYSTSALPRFSKTLRVQALTMKALYHLYQTTKDSRYLKAADAVMEYTQKNLSLDDGGYVLGVTYVTNEKGDNPCIWKLDEIKTALTEKEFQLASIAFGLKEPGNIPFVDNPQHLYSNKNSLSWKLSRAELASKTSMAPTTLEQTLQTITGKLAKLRSEKPSQPFVEKLETPGPTALLASAMVSAYRATGNPTHLEQATKILNHIRSRFIDQEGNLHRAYFKGSLKSDLATGADHALLSQAAIDLHEVTLDPSWLELAYDLHGRMNNLLANADNYHIMEYDGAGYPKTYDVKFYITLHVLDNDNTWALAHANAKRLALRRADDSLTSQWNHLQSYMLRISLAAPTSCIDFLTYECTEQGKKVYIKGPAAPELLAAACMQPCQIIAITEEGSYDELGADVSKIPSGTAVVTARGNKIGSASSPAELEALLK